MADDAAALSKGFRLPGEVIAHAVWLYHRFRLSLRDVEELLFVRGVVVSYETIRAWVARTGPEYGRWLRRRAPREGDKWHQPTQERERAMKGFRTVGAE